jgi:5S rRNA maturation endonuclease (ribonuclease M5)
MQEIENWILNLKQSKKLIIVEGKKDKIALNSLGIKNIITINKPLYKLTEEISSKTKECIILTDLDKEGKRLYHKLKHDLQKQGVIIDNKFREFLFKNTKLSNIEGINSYLFKSPN